MPIDETTQQPEGKQVEWYQVQRWWPLYEGRPSVGLERWKEHFEEVLNIRSGNIDILDGCNIRENLHIETINTSQMIDEVKCSIIKLKNGKRPSIDNINAECLTRA